MIPSEYAAGQQRCGSPAWNLPVVFGPIAITYNVKDLTSLILDGPTAAKIFNGTITTWNDPAIRALNAGVALPAEPIRVVFRTDDSGTTDNFQKYLDTASDDTWGKGAGKKFNGGVGEGAEGNDGTAAAVKRTEGAISYNEWSFAQAQHLNMAKIITSAGPDPVAISADSVEKTIGWGQRSSRSRATTSPSTRSRSTGPTSPAPTRSCWRRMRSCVRSIPIRRSVRPSRRSCKAPSAPARTGWRTTDTCPIPDAFKSRLSTAVNAIS